MKGYIIFSIVAAASVIAHVLFAGRHEFHIFADSLQWAVWFYCLIYIYDNSYLGKQLARSPSLVISAAFLVLHHLAMFIAPWAENVVAALFLIVVLAFGIKRFWEVLGDEN